MTKMVQAQDKIAHSQALAEALVMACSGIDNSDERLALQTLAQQVADQIKQAGDLIATHRQPTPGDAGRDALFALEPDVCAAHNAAQLLGLAVDGAKGEGDCNVIAFSAGQVADAVERLRHALYARLEPGSA